MDLSLCKSQVVNMSDKCAAQSIKEVDHLPKLNHGLFQFNLLVFFIRKRKLSHTLSHENRRQFNSPPLRNWIKFNHCLH